MLLSKGLSEPTKISNEEWKRGLQKLERIGFVYKEDIEDNNEAAAEEENNIERYRVEDVYLKRIVVSKDYLLNERRGATEDALLLLREKELCKEAVNCYSRFVDDNFSPVSELNLTTVYHRLIVRLKTESLRLNIYKEMVGKGLLPDLYVLNLMIRKAESLEEAENNYFNNIVLYGCTPNSQTLTAMVGRNRDLQGALKTYKELIENCSVFPDKYTLRVFIKLARKGDFHYIWPIFLKVKMHDKDKTIKDEGLYYGIIELVELFSDARLVFEEYRDNGVAKSIQDKYIAQNGDGDGRKMNIQFYESVIHKNGGEIQDVLEIYEILKSTANFGQIKAHTFASLIDRTTEDGFEIAKTFLQDAKNFLGQKIQPTVYTNLIKKCDSFSQAVFYLEDMLNFGLNTITPNPFNKALSFAKKPEEAKRVFDLMSQFGVPDDEDTRPFRVRHSHSVEEAFDYIDEIYENNNSDLTLRIVNEALSLLSKEDNWAKRGEWAEYFFIYIETEELYAGHTQNKVNRSFSLLIRNFRNTTIRLEKIRYALEYGATPGETNYWYCILWSRNWEEIENTFKLMGTDSVVPRVETVVDAVRKLVKDKNYTFLKFSTFVSFLNQSFSNLETEAYMGLFDVFAKTNVRPSATEELKKLYGQLNGMGKDISSEGYEILLWKEISNQKENIDLRLIREIYRRDYNQIIKIPTTYFENFFRRCSNYRTISLLYEDMVSLDVPRRVQTFEVMIDVITKKGAYPMSQIEEIILKANECNSSYPELLFDDLLKRPFPDNKRINLYDRLHKKGIKLSDQARQDIFWLKINKHNQSKSENESRQAFLLESIGDRKEIPNFLNDCVDFDDAIILLRRAAEKNKSIKEEVFEKVIWLATSKDQVDEVVERLAHRKIERSITVLCRQIKYAEDFEEARELYNEGIGRDPKFASTLAYNVMRRANSFSEAYSFFLEHTEDEKRFIPAFQHLLARQLRNSEDAVIYSDFLRSHSIILENETNKKLLFLLPGDRAWPYFDLIGVQLKNSQKNSLFRRLWQNLTTLKERRTTFSLNQALKKSDISFKEVLFYLKMAMVLEISLNEYTIREVTKKKYKLNSKKADELLKVLEGQPEGLFISPIDGPRLTDEKPTAQIVPVVQTKKSQKTNRLPFKDQWDSLMEKFETKQLSLLPKSTSTSQFNDVLDACEELEQVLLIKAFFENSNVLYSTKLFHKLILFTFDEGKCVSYLNKYLQEKTTAIPHMIFSSLVKSNHDPELKQKLLEIAINAGRVLPKGIINKLNKNNIVKTSRKGKRLKTHQSSSSFHRQIVQSKSFQEAKEIYGELVEHYKRVNKKVNQDVLLAFLSQARTFAEVMEVKQEIIRQKFPITEDILTKAFWATEASFEETYSVFEEIENNAVYRITIDHYHHLLKKEGGDYRMRKHLYQSMKVKGLLKKPNKECIKQTFRSIKDVNNAIEFYIEITLYSEYRPIDIYYSLPLDNDEITFSDSVDYLNRITAEVEKMDFRDLRAKNKLLPGRIFYEKLISKLSEKDHKATQEVFNLLKNNSNAPKLSVDYYNKLIKLVNNRQIAIEISEEMKSKGVRKNNLTHKLLQQYILPG
ncbi:MAG: hypothetical protein MI974_13315 [Chitinophagales bacterium]|nr:hypothetical protein [Chitinophagales bacterium]